MSDPFEDLLKTLDNPTIALTAVFGGSVVIDAAKKALAALPDRDERMRSEGRASALSTTQFLIQERCQSELGRFQCQEAAGHISDHRTRTVNGNPVTWTDI